MCRDKTISVTLAMALGSVLLLSACVGSGERAKISGSEETLSIGTSVDKSRAKAGETIKLTAVVKAKNDISAVEVKATLLIPAAESDAMALVARFFNDTAIFRVASLFSPFSSEGAAPSSRDTGRRVQHRQIALSQGTQ